MLMVSAIFAFGIILGFLLRKQTQLIVRNDKLIAWAIFLLLFMLGINVGMNEKIVNNIDNIGLQSLVLSLGVVLGSIICAWAVYKFFFIHPQKKDKNTD